MNEEIEYLRKVYQSEETSTWINKLQMKSIVDYADELQSNWNSLREELKQANRELVTNELVNGKELINNILDKMNELEGKDK